jgi:hypothetical protein
LRQTPEEAAGRSQASGVSKFGHAQNEAEPVQRVMISPKPSIQGPQLP